MKPSALTKSTKPALLMTALVPVLMGISVSNVQAGTCESASSYVDQVWNEYDDVVKGAGCVIVTALSSGAIAPNQCLDVANKVAETTEKMVSFWNKMANNGWATVGPRRLDYGATLAGTIVSKGERTFVSVQPADVDKAEVKIKKTDGKAETDVTVCSDYRGKKVKLWEFTIPNGNDNAGKVWTKSVSGLKGRELIVHLRGNSLTNTMSYELSVKRQ